MNKIALVTGASRGIGAGIARTLAAQGYDLGLNYCASREAAEALAQELTAAHGIRAVTLEADVSQAVQVERMFERMERELGDVTLLVNNAGIARQLLFTDITEGDWDRLFDVDVKGVFLCCRRALPPMVRAKAGCIVNISSIWGMVGASCEVHYSAAKAAVIGLTQALAKEVGPSGIRVNCVAPGLVMTEMNAALDEETIAALTEETPLGRVGTVEDIAQAVAFLASEQAGFITGQVLSPNGGMVI